MEITQDTKIIQDYLTPENCFFSRQAEQRKANILILIRLFFHGMIIISYTVFLAFSYGLFILIYTLLFDNLYFTNIYNL